LHKLFTIKGGSEPTFHLGCDYKKNLTLIVRTGKQIDNPNLMIKEDCTVEYEPTKVTRDYWFISTKSDVSEALIECAKIMGLKPITKGGLTISPVEQIRKARTSIIIKLGITLAPIGRNRALQHNRSLCKNNDFCNSLQMGFLELFACFCRSCKVLFDSFR
jgi:hypothetical protein